MSVSASSASSPDLVQLLMLEKQMTAQAAQSAQLLEGLSPQPAAPTPVRPTPQPGTYYL